MITLRRSAERGRSDAGWLDSRHTFSFAEYHDPEHTGFRTLRVINEDRVAPGSGFPTHPHRDMEIVSYVLEGALAHEDSLGNGSVIRPGDIQRMSAGTGVRHSEWNASKEAPVHFLQIWIVPAVRGIAPSYEQRSFAPAELEGRLRLVGSPDGREGSVTLHQDAAIWVARLATGGRASLDLAPGRHAWVQAARGALRVGGVALEAGDGAAVSGEAAIEIEGASAAEALVLDLS